MIARVGLVFLITMACSPAAAQSAPVEPSEQPAWAIIRQKGEALMRGDLFDPASAQITWVQGFSWDAVKPIQLFAKRSWGWIGCATINAKNRYGGYVGATTVAVRVDPKDHAVNLASTYDVSSKCDRTGAGTPLQSELTSSGPTTGFTHVEQLAKLAEMLDKGLISRVEFDQEKARILAPAH